jgi:hypothetical protein
MANPAEVVIAMGDREKILVAYVLRQVRAQAHRLMDIHGDERGAAAVETVAAELGIDLGPMEED